MFIALLAVIILREDLVNQMWTN